MNILFLCTGNSCRSQMAEGWGRHLKSGMFTSYSAGIETHGLNPNAVKVMHEVGVDISTHVSKHVDELMPIECDFVITLCGHANETCPIFRGSKKVVHVAFEDPPKLAEKLAKEGASMEKQLDCYRKVRDEIRSFVETLPEILSNEL